MRIEIEKLLLLTTQYMYVQVLIVFPMNKKKLKGRLLSSEFPFHRGQQHSVSREKGTKPFVQDQGLQHSMLEQSLISFLATTTNRADGNKDRRAGQLQTRFPTSQ